MKESFTKQSGVTLIFSLVILVSLTMIGITSIQITKTELSMAGNQRESSLMFQAAEMGLNSAEAFIEASTTNADFDNAAAGLYTVVGDDPNYVGPDYFDDSDWMAKSQEAGIGVYSSAKPLFIVEYLGDRDQNPLVKGLLISNYGANAPGITVSIFRPTSRGVGLTGNSFRYLQSYYGKEKDS